MSDHIDHNCGYCVAHTLHDAYSFLDSLQHRGREASGIAAVGDNRIDTIKWIGPVGKLSKKAILNILGRNNYHTFLGHVRYATKGAKDMDSLLNDAHPHTISGEVIRNESHEITLDCDAAIVHNGHVKDKYMPQTFEGLRTKCDSEKLLHYVYHFGEEETLRNIPLAYSAAIADKRKKGVIVLRDRTGIKPGILGIKDNKHCVTSEDIALMENGGRPVEDLIPGTIYYLDPEGNVERQKVISSNRKLCMFEYQYISAEPSTNDGINVRIHRTLLGKILSEEFDHSNIDFVTYLPESPEIAARSFSRHSEIPFLNTFYKMRNERSFQGSTPNERKRSIQSNLHLSPHAISKIRGKRGVLIDDSMVRGNNIKHAAHLLKEVAGVEEITYLLYTPPIGILDENGEPTGCEYGVDMPLNDDFIARGRSLEEISKEIGMNVQFISKEGHLKAFQQQLKDPQDNLCLRCIGEEQPFQE